MARIYIDVHAVKMLEIHRKMAALKRDASTRAQRNALGREFECEMAAAGLPRLFKPGIHTRRGRATFW